MIEIGKNTDELILHTGRGIQEFQFSTQKLETKKSDDMEATPEQHPFVSDKLLEDLRCLYVKSQAIPRGDWVVAGKSKLAANVMESLLDKSLSTVICVTRDTKELIVALQEPRIGIPSSNWWISLDWDECTNKGHALLMDTERTNGWRLYEIQETGSVELMCTDKLKKSGYVSLHVNSPHRILFTTEEERYKHARRSKKAKRLIIKRLRF